MVRDTSFFRSHSQNNVRRRGFGYLVDLDYSLMHVGVPQTVANSLFETLESFFVADEMPSEFELRRIEKAADNLAKVDAAAAFTVKGAIAALRWDADSAETCCRKACALERSPMVLNNSALTFKFLNRFDLAIEFAKSALALAPLDPLTATSTLGYLFATGHFAEVAALIRKHNYQEEQYPSLPFQALEFDRLRVDLGISTEQIDFEIDSVFSVLKKHKKRMQGSRVEAVNDPDGGQCIVIEIEFFGDLHQEIVLEAELAHALAASPDWNPSRLSVEFAYIALDVSQPA